MSIERVVSPLPQSLDDIQPSGLKFYCKDCKKVVAATQTKKKFKFQCPLCGGTHVAYGTGISIQNHYRLAESDMTPATKPIS